MKTIVFVALLAAAGCSKKSADCDASIAEGMEKFTASVSANDSNPQMRQNRLNVISKLRGTLTQRCNEDKWPAEVVSCFTTVASMREMQICQAKLSNEQRTRLVNEIRQAMMGSMGSMRMPNGVPGHPPMLGSGSGAGPGGPAPGGGGMSGSAAGSGTAPAGSAQAPAGSAQAPVGSSQAPARPPAPAAAGSAAPPAAAGSGGW